MNDFDEEFLESLRQENAALEERIKREFADRRAVEHHTRCRDCGHFVGKQLWVRLDSSRAINHGLRPICPTCAIEYDWD